MDHFARLKRQIWKYIFAILLINSAALLASWWVLEKVLHPRQFEVLIILSFEAIVLAFIIVSQAISYVTEPVKLLWLSILHVSPNNKSSEAPNLDKSRVGRELVTSLAMQVYQLANTSITRSSQSSVLQQRAQIIATNLPLPLLVMDKNQTIIFSNDAASKYLNLAKDGLVGKNLYNVLPMSFSSQDTFDKWLAEARSQTIISSHSWERVRLTQVDHPKPLLFDMAAYYSKQSSTDIETIVTLFDHTATYSQDDDAVSFVALAVHELRIPLTLLRGYIELFQEEFTGKLSPELAGFMSKMEDSAEKLTVFVNNILNLARVDSDQLILSLHQESWNDVVTTVVKDLQLRASVQNKQIEVQLAPNIPPVAVDEVSMYEVLGNLLDNAIKYGGANPKIIVKTSLGKDGLVETDVQDFGVGVPQNVVPHLFERYQRNYHTSQQIGGTGLGLYLSKAIVTAHGGNIWIRSKENQGTVVGFTLKPYAQVANELKSSENKEITRQAHGWIKNHSLYRR